MGDIVCGCGHCDGSLCTGGSLLESFATGVVGIVKSRVNSMILLPTLPLTRYLYILVWFLHCKALHSISRTLIHPFPSLSGVIAHCLAVVVVSPLLLTYHGPMWVLYAVYSLCIYVRSIGWSLVVVPCRLSAMLACRESGIMAYLRVP